MPLSKTKRAGWGFADAVKKTYDMTESEIRTIFSAEGDAAMNQHGDTPAVASQIMEGSMDLNPSKTVEIGIQTDSLVHTLDNETLERDSVPLFEYERIESDEEREDAIKEDPEEATGFEDVADWEPMLTTPLRPIDVDDL